MLDAAKEFLKRKAKWALGGARILLYHRVSSESPDPQQLCVSPSNFAEHCEYLKRYYRVIDLVRLAVLLKENHNLRGYVVLTFDDGYADIFWNAYATLEKHELPGTIFVATRYLDYSGEMVHDEIERLVLLSEWLSPIIDVTIRGEAYRWKLAEDTSLCASHVGASLSPTSRYRCYVEIHRLLRELDYDDRVALLDSIRPMVRGTPQPRASRRCLSSDELRILVASGLIKVGAHTHSHIKLARHSRVVQLREIETSKRMLEEVTSSRVAMFAYPYGGRDAADEITRGCVRGLCFDLACDNVVGTVRRNSDLFGLPRFLVRNWSVEEFCRQMRVTFGS